jgi:glycosyltransferase involved in cell wall biosynthesis
MTASAERGKRITILFLNLFAWLGGGEYSVYNLVKNIESSLYRPILLFNKSGPFPAKTEAIGIETVVIPYEIVEPKKLLSPLSLVRNFKASLAIRRFIRDERVDIIQCSDVFALVLLLPSLVTLRTPVIYSMIVFYGRLRCWFLSLFGFLFVKRIIANSSAVKNDLLNKSVGLRGKTEVAYNGIDPEIFYPRTSEDRMQIRHRLGLPTGKKVIGFIGRFEVWKGHGTFLEAARDLLSSRDDLFFLMVGGAITQDVAPEVGRYRNEILKRLKELDLEGKVLMFDHRDDIAEIMASLDVYVCPSDAEPFGLVALEAFASGVPVVASNTVGAMEVLGSHEGVFIAEPQNPSSFVGQIEAALRYADNKRDRAPDSVEIRSRNQFTWRTYAGKFEALYQAAVE